MDEARHGLDGLVAAHAVGGYERVRFVDDDGRTKNVLLSRVRTSGAFVTGIEVDKEGDEVSGVGFDQRRRVISKTTILKRTSLQMSSKYAELVADKTRIDLGGGWWAARAENVGPRGGARKVFNAWHKSQAEDVLTFAYLRAAQTWADEHPIDKMGAELF